MTTRPDYRKKSAQDPKTPQMTKGPLLGLAAVCLLGMACMYLWTTRHAPVPVAPVATKHPIPPYPRTHRSISTRRLPILLPILPRIGPGQREHKRVILDFGGDWCGDCQVLDIYFHQAPNADLLQKNFVLVHVWIGHMDTNIDVAARYGVPISKGCPRSAVLDAEGKVLYAQATGQFNDMRHMEPTSVTEFLNTWKS